MCLPDVILTPIKTGRIWCDLSTQVDRLTNYTLVWLSVYLLLKEYLHLYFLTLVIIVDAGQLQVTLSLSHLRKKRFFFKENL